jgi:hypothetical protein
MGAEYHPIVKVQAEPRGTPNWRFKSGVQVVETKQWVFSVAFR